LGRDIVYSSAIASTNLHVFAWVANMLPPEWEAKVDAALMHEESSI
jgi:hypothetical protein